MKSRLTVEYVSLPPEREAQWWAAMRWIVELLKREAQSLDGGGLRSWHWIGRDAMEAW